MLLYCWFCDVYVFCFVVFFVFFFQAEDGIRDAQESRGLGDVYKRQGMLLGIVIAIFLKFIWP